VRVEYVPKSQRKSGGATSSAPKPPPPSIEPMPASLASEFTDFDDGPAKVLDVVQGVVVGGESESAGGKKGKKAKGSRKRKSK
jgi:YidC/Oxa1 family membrane protein insertase